MGQSWSVPRRSQARHHRRFHHPRVEALEARRLLTTYMVMNTKDSGAGSLRQAILDVNNDMTLDTIGFATEHASGTYSRGARGFFVEGGEIAYPIDEFTIAGLYSEMLAGIDAVANDLRFDAPVVSPSFRVAEMTVSGN